MTPATLFCPETEWTLYWERALRRRRWVEHDGRFYPIGTTPAELRLAEAEADKARKLPRVLR